MKLKLEHHEEIEVPLDNMPADWIKFVVGRGVDGLWRAESSWIVDGCGSHGGISKYSKTYSSRYDALYAAFSKVSEDLIRGINEISSFKSRPGKFKKARLSLISHMGEELQVGQIELF